MQRKESGDREPTKRRVGHAGRPMAATGLAQRAPAHPGDSLRLPDRRAETVPLLRAGGSDQPRNARSDEDLLRGHARAGPTAVIGHHLVLNAALVRAAADAEVALLTPVRVPAVLHLPVLDAAIHAPPDDLDRVPAQLLIRRRVVDAASVVLEVLVDRERSLHRAVLHDLRRD